MCIIMYQKGGNEVIEKEALLQAARVNDDGMGIAYNDGDSLMVYKTMTDFEEIVNRYHWARDKQKPVLLHFRIATRGTVDISNCQPFRLGEDIVMAHNGTISFKKVPDGMSDTRYFRDGILDDIGDLIFERESLFHLLEYYVGRGNKVVFMRKNGEALILNENLGHWEGDTWFSNYSYQSRVTGSLNELSKKFQKKQAKLEDEQEEDNYETVGDLEDYEIIEEGCVYKDEPLCYGCLPSDAEEKYIDPLYESRLPYYCNGCGFWLSDNNPHLVARRNAKA